jgi:N-dimethylarginine dimethylaminohydrolase
MSWFLNRKVVMLDGFPSSREKLEEEGVDVIPVDMSEFIKSSGPYCASAPIRRGPVPKL